MKAINLKPLTTSVFLAIILFTSVSCKKEKTGIDALPPATQEGKNTFGCLVNGVALVREKSLAFNPDGYRTLKSTYSYNNNLKYYFLSISGSKKSPGNTLQSINLFISNNEPVLEGKTYKLKISNIDQRAEGNYYVGNPYESDLFETNNDIYIGELFISKLDEKNLIVSGTFWFDGVNKKGEKVEVREGRFDVKYLE